MKKITEKTPIFALSWKKVEKFSCWYIASCKKNAEKAKKNFVSFGKGCIFAVPFEMEKEGERRGEIIESKQKPKAACHGPCAAGRMVVAGNEKGNKDNSEILTMKSLILAQDER